MITIKTELGRVFNTEEQWKSFVEDLHKDGRKPYFNPDKFPCVAFDAGEGCTFEDVTSKYCDAVYQFFYDFTED